MWEYFLQSLPSQSWPCFPCVVAAPHAWRTDWWTLQSRVHFWRASGLFSSVQWAAHKLFRDGHSHAGVTQSSKHCCSTQVESETPADSLRRPQHLFKLLHVRQRSEHICISEATSQISILFQEFQTLWSKCIRLSLGTGAENWSRPQHPTTVSGRKKESGLLGTFHR